MLASLPKLWHFVQHISWLFTKYMKSSCAYGDVTPGGLFKVWGKGLFLEALLKRGQKRRFVRYRQGG